MAGVALSHSAIANRSVAPRAQTRAVWAGPVPMRDSQMSSARGRGGAGWERVQAVDPATPTQTTKLRSARPLLIQRAAYTEKSRSSARPRRQLPQQCLSLAHNPSRADLCGFRSVRRVTPGPSYRW